VLRALPADTESLTEQKQFNPSGNLMPSATRPARMDRPPEYPSPNLATNPMSLEPGGTSREWQRREASDNPKPSGASKMTPSPKPSINPMSRETGWFEAAGVASTPGVR
jgi:hypothetical protein